MLPEKHPLAQLLKRDDRYPLEAYEFIREALGYAQDYLGLGEETPERIHPETGEPERHLTGDQLCEAIRLYAIEQYGYMAKTVLNSWNLHETSDFGDVVYNLIDIQLMKKSDDDRREHFDNAFDFNEAFCAQFRISMPGDKVL